jgi:hypothetical protein
MTRVMTADDGASFAMFRRRPGRGGTLVGVPFPRITHKNENGVATVVVDTVHGDEWSHVEISEAGRRTRQTGWPTPSTSVAS